MKKFRAIVKHTGSCAGEHFKAGVPTPLSEDVIKALGPDVRVLEQIPEEEKQEVKEEVKEVKNPLNKMVGKEDVKTK